jgi:predicted dehydrogenase
MMRDLVSAAPELEPGVGPLRPVRVAVVGLGRMGVAHAAVLSMLPDVTLVGAVDDAPAAARRLRGMGFRVLVSASLDALLGATKPDAIWVCTPPDSHLAIARRCVERGIAVFVEKPLAHALDAARALAALATETTVPVACGYTLAYWPSFVAARELLAAGVLGPPRRAVSSMFLSEAGGPRRGWMYDRARSGGGVVANLSSHLLFVLRAYFGMPTTVRATWVSDGAVEDELTATFATPGCPEVIFESSWRLPGYPSSVTTVTVDGGNGTLSVRNDGLAIDLREARAGLPAGETRIAEADLPGPAGFLLNGEAYTLEDAHVLRWVTGGPAPTITAAAALDVQRVMDALYRSAAAGGAAVDLP